MVSNRENTLLRDCGACFRSPMKAHTATGHPIGEVTLRLHRYVATKTLPKCPTGNSNTRIFAKGDTVDVIFPENASKDNDVWLIAYKNNVRNIKNAVKLWKRSLSQVLAYCDPAAFDALDVIYPVTATCEMRRDPHKRGAEGYVACLRVALRDPAGYLCEEDSAAPHVWVERGIFPDTVFSEPAKDAAFAPPPPPSSSSFSQVPSLESPSSLTMTSSSQSSSSSSCSPVNLLTCEMPIKQEDPLQQQQQQQQQQPLSVPVPAPVFSQMIAQQQQQQQQQPFAVLVPQMWVGGCECGPVQVNFCGETVEPKGTLYYYYCLPEFETFAGDVLQNETMFAGQIGGCDGFYNDGYQ